MSAAAAILRDTTWAAFADAWAAALWRASWQGGLAIALAWLLTQAFARMPATIRCWVWRLAFLKLLLALVWGTPLRLPLLPPVNATHSQVIANSAITTAVDTPSAATVPAAPETHTAAPASPPRRSSRGTILFFTLWTAGVAAGLARLAWGFAAARRLRRRCRPIHDAALTIACADLAARHGLPRPPPLSTVDEHDTRPAVPTPLLLGPLRPLIVLPAHALARHSPAELRLMLAHELAHLKRGDLWWNWLPAAAQALLFFHPLVWLASREWRLAQETACDEAAVNAAGATPSRYGDMLLGLIAPRQRRRTIFPRFPATAAAGVVESMASVRRRLTAMKHFPHPSAAPRRARTRILAAVALALSGVAGIVPWKVVAQQGAPPETDQLDLTVTVDGTGAPGDGASPGDAPAPQDASALGDVTVPRDAPAPGGEGEGPAAPPRAEGELPARDRSFLKSAEAKIAARTEGVVVDVPAQEGQLVKKGQVLVQLDHRKPLLALQATEARLAAAEAVVRRLKGMVERKQASNTELEEALAQVKQIQIEVNLRQQDVEDTRVVAPIDGALERLSARPGEFVARGGELARLVSLDAFWTDVLLENRLATRLKAGDPVSVYPGRRLEHPIKARVRYVSNVVRSGTQTTLVRVDLLDPPKGLKPGLEVIAEFGTAE